MVMLLAGLQSIPRELYEAAAIDGATCSTNSVTSRCAWRHRDHRPAQFDLDRAFDPVYVIPAEGGSASEVLATAIYFDGFQKLKFGYVSAQAVVMFLVLFVVSAFYVRRAMSNAQ
jgi:multiple sugar transport system permease protein